MTAILLVSAGLGTAWVIRVVAETLTREIERKLGRDWSQRGGGSGPWPTYEPFHDGEDKPPED